MRQLLWMLAGRRLHDWTRTAELLAMTANVNLDRFRRRTPFRIHEMLPEDLRRELPDAGGLTVDDLDEFVAAEAQ